MRKLITGIVAGFVFVFSGYAPTAFAADFTLANGTYKATFPQGAGCGTMVIKNAGKTISYSAGPCGGNPNYRNGGTFDGKVIRIQAATYTLSNTTSSSLKGRWKLGSYSATVTFKK